MNWILLGPNQEMTQSGVGSGVAGLQEVHCGLHVEALGFGSVEI